MYVIIRNNRKQFKGMAFETYEKARQFLRKHIRKLVSSGRADRAAYSNEFVGQYLSDGVYAPMMAQWDNVSRNPVNYTNQGWHIKQLSA